MDIYSEWAGPCTAMSGALKKIKLEVGDDTLVYAMAKSDTIPQLEMFRGHCKPTYLFMASGQPVAVMHGANAPLMRTMVSEQMDLERRVLAGEVKSWPHGMPVEMKSIVNELHNTVIILCT